MFHRRPGQPHLTVIVVSCRPKWLVNCLYQFSRQQTILDVELIVVIEGNPETFSPVLRQFGVRRFYFKDVEGNCGAFAKDVGISRATGEYLVFWDDDNIYYDDALSVLYETARGADIGIARAKVQGLDFSEVPANIQRIHGGDIDTMCCCVRRTLAVREKWSTHLGAGTDYQWLGKLKRHDPIIRFSDKCVGIHLN